MFPIGIVELKILTCLSDINNYLTIYRALKLILSGRLEQSSIYEKKCSQKSLSGQVDFYD